MSDKKNINCTTGEITYKSFTTEEIAQREYEASLPPIEPPISEAERIKNLEDAINMLMFM